MKSLLYIIALAMVTDLTFSYAVRAEEDKLQAAQEMIAAGEYKAAFKEVQELAHEETAYLAHFYLALFYQNGWGRAVNPVAACTWYEKAATGDIPVAVHAVAECLEQGVTRLADPKNAAILYQKAYDLGHFTSLCSLGKLYMEGVGVPKEPEKAISLCAQAANQGSIPAQIQVGLLLLDGDESTRDFVRAKYWFQLAAEKENPEAQYYLGVMARDGLGQPKDYNNARIWFELAASQGFSAAYLPAGQLFFYPPPGMEGEMPSEAFLAKAYLWASAAVVRTEDAAAKNEAENLLRQITEVMPINWKLSLDEKVSMHLAEFSPNQSQVN